MVTLSRVQVWYDKMVRMGEANLPIKFGIDILTPTQVLDHAKKNDDVWKRIQPYINE